MLTKSVSLDRSAAASVWVDSTVVFGMFVGTFVLAFLIYDHMHSESVAIALKLIPYAAIFAFVVWRRYLAHPFFPIGSPALVFWRAPLLWGLAAGIAAYCAFRFGAFSPDIPMKWRVSNFVNDVIEAPFAEEFAFRGVILTSLNATTLGTRSYFGFRLGTLLSACAFSSVHLLLIFRASSLIEVLPAVASALLAGLVFGYVYQRTGNLWYGMFMHALGNLTQLLP